MKVMVPPTKRRVLLPSRQKEMSLVVSDFDGIGSLPEGLEDVSGYPVLLGELLSRGWSREDLAKVAGLNVLRVMREAERIARELQKSQAPIEVLFKTTDSDPSTD
jgi:membrane dipeptidase